MCAIKSDTSAVCWGNNGNTALGVGTGAGTYEAPFTLINSGALAFDGGAGHSCFVMTGGKVECRGFNQSGQLGTTGGGTEIAQAVVVPNISDATAVALGDLSSCALRSGGTVACWGYNATGQLGNGATSTGFTPNPTPTAVQNLTNVTSLTGYDRHTCAVRSDNSLWCWGINTALQLGYDSYYLSTQAKPVQTSSGALSGVIGAATGGWHTCAQKSDRTTWCWGNNKFAQLGGGSGAPAESALPLQVSY